MEDEQATGADESAAYEDTLFHIDMLTAKRQRLLDAQLDAERQVLHRIGRDYVAGKLSKGALYTLYSRYRKAVVYEDRPGYSKLWDEAIPVKHARIAYYARSMARHAPNHEDSWSGAWPITDDSFPMRGQNVVYVLFDAENVPCYVGSTGQFRARLNGHKQDKTFTRWMAYACEDRESAYVLEEKLLLEHKPYMNKRAGR